MDQSMYTIYIPLSAPPNIKRTNEIIVKIKNKFILIIIDIGCVQNWCSYNYYFFKTLFYLRLLDSLLQEGEEMNVP